MLLFWGHEENRYLKSRIGTSHMRHLRVVFLACEHGPWTEVYDLTTALCHKPRPRATNLAHEYNKPRPLTDRIRERYPIIQPRG